MYFVLFGLLPAGWLVEASAELLGGLNLFAPLLAAVEHLAPLPAVGEELAPLPGVVADLAPLPAAAGVVAYLAPLPVAAGEEFVVDDDGAPLALPVADEAAPWCHFGTVLFACNQKIKQLYNDQSIEMNIQVISK